LEEKERREGLHMGREGRERRITYGSDERRKVLLMAREGGDGGAEDEQNESDWKGCVQRVPSEYNDIISDVWL